MWAVDPTLVEGEQVVSTEELTFNQEQLEQLDDLVKAVVERLSQQNKKFSFNLVLPQEGVTSGVIEDIQTELRSYFSVLNLTLFSSKKTPINRANWSSVQEGGLPRLVTYLERKIPQTLNKEMELANVSGKYPPVVLLTDENASEYGQWNESQPYLQYLMEASLTKLPANLRRPALKAMFLVAALLAEEVPEQTIKELGLLESFPRGENRMLQFAAAQFIQWLGARLTQAAA